MRLSEALLRLDEVNDFNKDIKIVGEIQRYLKKFDYIETIVRASRENDLDHKIFIIGLYKSSKRLFNDYECLMIDGENVSMFDFAEQQKIQNLTEEGQKFFGQLGAYQKALCLKYSVKDIKFSIGLLKDYKETGPKPKPPEEEQEKFKK